MKKSDYSVMFYFLTWCKSKAKGWNDLADAMLNAIHCHGYDVKDIGGKWNLVKLQNETPEMEVIND